MKLKSDKMAFSQVQNNVLHAQKMEARKAIIILPFKLLLTYILTLERLHSDPCVELTFCFSIIHSSLSILYIFINKACGKCSMRKNIVTSSVYMDISVGLTTPGSFADEVKVPAY